MDKKGQMTALGEALAPLRSKMRRGEPVGFSTASNAATAARKVLYKLNVLKPLDGTHYKIIKEPEGTYAYVLMGGPRASLDVSDAGEVVVRPRAGRGRTIGAILYDGRPLPRRSDVAKRAIHAARVKLEVADPKDGEHYELFEEDGGWRFRILGDHRARGGVRRYGRRTEGQPLRDKHEARKAAIGAARKLWGRSVAPQEGIHYRLEAVLGDKPPRGRQWAFWLIRDKAAQPEPAPVTLPDQSPPEGVSQGLWEQYLAAIAEAEAEGVAPVQPSPNVYLSPSHPPSAHPVRQPSLEDNRRIREAVDSFYDEPLQCWSGDLSDAACAEKLKVPRAWVTRVRELYGPDRNQAADLKKRAQPDMAHARIKAAIVLSEQAIALANQIIDMGGKLETMLAELKIKQKEIGG